MLKVAREKQRVNYKGTTIRLSIDFSVETLHARSGMIYSKSWKGKPCYLGYSMLCLVALCDPMDYSPPGSSVHGDSPSKNTRVGCHFFNQGIFPNQGSNPGLLHCRWLLYHLSHEGTPWILYSARLPFRIEGEIKNFSDK